MGLQGPLLAAGALVLVPVVAVGAAVAAVVAEEGDAPPAGVVCSPTGPAREVAGYAAAQVDNAAQIVAAGRERGLPQEAWVIAVATAMAESTLRQVGHGDAAGPDSRGLFQQRSSWGPESVRMDPKGSAHLFYDRLVALQNPTWQQAPSLSSNRNPAQRVQRSALPLRYAQFEGPARAVVGAVLGVACSKPPAGAPSPHAQVVIDRALSQVGVRYAWAGGTADGPSMGRGPDAGVLGYDCSGLALYAYAGAGVSVPHQTRAIWDRFGPAITDRSQIQPGDLILLSSTGAPGGIHHVGIALGGGRVVEAPQSGQTVQVRQDIWAPGSNYAQEFLGAVRPGT